MNVIFNIILLKYVGPIGSAIATAICYFVLWIYRIINTHKIINIKYEVNRIILTVILLIINTIVITLQINLWYIFSIVIVILIIAVNLKNVIIFFKSGLKILREKFNQLKEKRRR